MIHAYTVEQLRAAEAQALACAAPGALMQRAAAGLAVAAARLLRRRYGAVTGRRVVLLVGAGNNGGDALWAGARLAGRGARVSAVLTAPTVHEPGAAALRAAGGWLLDARAETGAAEASTAILLADVVLDGLVGLGGSAGLRPPADRLVAGLPPELPVIAVDLPSGVDPDTGATPGQHVRAELTVSFGADTLCLLLPPGDRAAGRVVRVDLGMAPHLPVQPAATRLEPADVGACWPVPAATDDKYRRGVLGMVTGSVAYPGAAVLTVAGALGAGAGMVRYLGPAGVSELVLARHPEVVPAPGRVQAWALGSGVDPTDVDRAAELHGAFGRALAEGVPALVDAGGLALLPERVPPGWLLTPHAGELAGLLTARGRAVDRAQVEAEPLRHLREAVAVTGATILLKGATTLVAAPDGTLFSQADGPSWLATAGSGDALAGIAGALLAAGVPAARAAAMAALVHGRAGWAAARGADGDGAGGWAGPAGPVTATDVARSTSAVIASLTAETLAR